MKKTILYSSILFFICNSGWSQCLQELSNFSPIGTLDAGSDYGKSMSLSGDYLAIAETSNDSLAPNSGIIYIYKTQSDNSWEKVATLAASNPTENFYLGHFLDFSENVIMAGSGALPGNKIYVFTKDEEEEWTNSTEEYSFQIRESIDSKPVNTKAISASSTFLAVSYTYSYTFSDDYEVNTNIYEIGSIEPVASIPSVPIPENSFFEVGPIEFGTDFLAISYPYYRGEEIGNNSGIVSIHEFDTETGWSITPSATLSTSLTDQVHFGIDIAINNDTVFAANGYGQENNQFESQIFGFVKPETGWNSMTESFILTTGKVNSNSSTNVKISVNDNYLIHSKWIESDISVFKKATNWKNQNPDLTFDLPVGDHYENPVLSEKNLILNARSNPFVINYFRELGDFENLTSEYDSLEEPIFNAANSKFGQSLSLNSNHMVIGAPADGSGGAAYYYIKVSGQWQLHSKLASPFENAFFGNAVELRDSLLFISAIFVDSLNADGSFFLPSAGKVLQYEMIDGNWEFRNSLVSPDLNEGNISDKAHFGRSISYSDGYVAIGRYYTGSSETDGRVFIYKEEGDNWTYTATMQPELDVRGDFFGMTTKMTDSVLFVGASVYGFRGSNSSGSAVFVFNRNSSGWSSSFEDAKLITSDDIQYDIFGSSISINKNTVAVGAPNGDQSESNQFSYAGQAYLFEMPEEGWYGEINEKFIFSPETRTEGSYFGSSVFISDTEILITGLLNENGKIFRFDRSLQTLEETNILYEQEIIYPTTPTIDGDFGSLIVGDNTDIFISDVSSDTEEGFQSGEVFRFHSNNSFSRDTLISCDSYTWLDSTYFESGNYIVSIPNLVGCDSLLYLNLTILGRSEGSEDMEVCDSYEWEGMTLTESGTYSVTLSNTVGCDSLATLNLQILESSEGSEDLQACDSYQWEGMTLNESGTYSVTLSNAVGCDSLAMLNLQILESSEGSADLEICDSYQWEGMTLNESGTYSVTLTNAIGCDSIATLNLNIFKTEGSLNMQACDSYQWEGVTFNESGSYSTTLTNAIGCDSLATLNLSIFKTEGSLDLEACDSYQWEGMTLNESGSYSTTLTNAIGCDSLATLNLKIFESSEGSEDLQACDSYQWEGMTLTESGTYSVTLSNIVGCDSLATLNLQILESSKGSEDLEACDSYQWEGMTLTESGTYSITLSNTVGCDSLATLNITILEGSEGSEDLEVCDSYQWEGVTLTESGSYTTTLTNTIGCDSLATLNLNVLESSKGSADLEVCDSYEWEGMTLTESGTYSITLSNDIGCDSLATLNLQILESSKGSEDLEVCDSYQWEGMTLTESGSYSAILVNEIGCDSIATLNLSITEIKAIELEFLNNIISWPIDNPDNSYIFQWYDCSSNLPIIDATSSEFIINETGDYRLRIDDGVCMSFSDCISVELILSIDEIGNMIYPNPTYDQLYVSKDLKFTKLFLTDLSGKVQQAEFSDHVFDLSGIVAGIYILTIENGDKIMTIKFKKN